MSGNLKKESPDKWPNGLKVIEIFLLAATLIFVMWYSFETYNMRKIYQRSIYGYLSLADISIFSNTFISGEIRSEKTGMPGCHIVIRLPIKNSGSSPVYHVKTLKHNFYKDGKEQDPSEITAEESILMPNRTTFKQLDFFIESAKYDLLGRLSKGKALVFDEKNYFVLVIRYCTYDDKKWEYQLKYRPVIPPQKIELNKLMRADLLILKEDLIEL